MVAEGKCTVAPTFLPEIAREEASDLVAADCLVLAPGLRGGRALPGTIDLHPITLLFSNISALSHLLPCFMASANQI